ncbi:TPA: hypothetical protein ACH3X1_012565 [Trebouxia sp. C0004]
MAQPTDKQSVVELEAEVDKGPQTPALQKQQIAVGSKRSAYGSTGRSFSKRPASQAPTSTAVPRFARGRVHLSSCVTQRNGKQSSTAL